MQEQSDMNNTINFSEERTAQRTGCTPREYVAKKSRQINEWLDTTSKIYSRIAEFSVTRRTVIRVNLITVCFVIAGAAIEQAPFVAITAGICAGYVVKRLNAK